MINHAFFVKLRPRNRGNKMTKLRIPLLIATAFALGACAPVGSEAWCKKMAEKPKGDWTANEASEYAKSCIFKTNDN